MIPNDMTEIYVAYYIGKKGNKNYYTQPKKINANVVENNLLITEESIGKFRNFDLTLNIPQGDDVQYINEDCVFWIHISPNENADNYDFIVNRLGNNNRELVTVYCDSVTPNNSILYYTNNGKDIYGFKLQYNKSKNAAIVRMNTYIPFNEDSTIWNKKPNTASDTDGRIVYSDKIIRGNSFIIEFEDYDGNG